MICWGPTTALAPWSTSCRFIFSSFDEILTLAMILGWRFRVDWWGKQHAASANGSDGLNAGPHFAHAVRSSGHRCQLGVSGSSPRSKLPNPIPIRSVAYYRLVHRWCYRQTMAEVELGIGRSKLNVQTRQLPLTYMFWENLTSSKEEQRWISIVLSRIAWHPLRKAYSKQQSIQFDGPMWPEFETWTISWSHSTRKRKSSKHEPFLNADFWRSASSGYPAVPGKWYLSPDEKQAQQS
jgi:hypothetical protein